MMFAVETENGKLTFVVKRNGLTGVHYLAIQIYHKKKDEEYIRDGGVNCVFPMDASVTINSIVHLNMYMLQGKVIPKNERKVLLTHVIAFMQHFCQLISRSEQVFDTNYLEANEQERIQRYVMFLMEYI
jgi:hypothetical protein